MPQGSKSSAVVYQPTILRSMAEICETFGVGPKTVKVWVTKGAPIAVEGEGANTRYSAEITRLQVWREHVQSTLSIA